MPILDVRILSGRDAATKARLIADLTQVAVDVLDVKPAAVRVLITELPPEHWGVGGVPKAAAGPTEPDHRRNDGSHR